MMEKYMQKFSDILQTEDKEACVAWVKKNLDEGSFNVVELYVDILTPALNSIECTMENEAMCIWKEHVKTSIVRSIIEMAYPHVLNMRDETCNGKKKSTVLILCPPNELHEIGARMVADFFTIAGFNTIFIGSNTPKHAFLAAIKEMEPKYVGISITNTYHLFKTHKIITEIRDAASGTGLKIILGGSVFNEREGLLEDLNADLQLMTFKDICTLD
ncbi:cobalamin-binding protein [Candidatus Bathyarchaeota archaeon]|nr:cobalamin-binding protein [Candidatus Bathyarchaeota archaeon]